MYFADQAVSTRTLKLHDLEKLAECIRIDQLLVWLSLKILSIIPLANWIFDFANAGQIAVYFAHFITSFFSQISVFVIGQHRIFRRYWQIWVEPLYRVKVHHSLHTAKVDWDLNCVLLTNLDGRLHARPLYQVLKNDLVFTTDGAVSLW
jgi:hypothetical protein